MSVMKKTVSVGLIAVSLAGALMAAAPAEARDRHRNVWPGVAAGVAGGLIGGAIIAGSQDRRVYLDEPEYDYAPPPPPPPRVVYREVYRPAPPPRCHFEWVENEYGESYRARVCY